MNDAERLEAQLTKWESNLRASEEAFYLHITKEHGGYPVTNCHTCKGWVGLIRSAEGEINSVRNTIYSFKQSRG